MFGLMVIIMFGLMIGLMVIIMTMFSGSGGWWPGMWGVMILPVLGMLIMPLIMFFVFRMMTGSGGFMSGVMVHRHNTQSQTEENNITTLTYNIPAVNCAHCKMTIEAALKKVPGVEAANANLREKTVGVDGDVTLEEIKRALADAGYESDERRPL